MSELFVRGGDEPRESEARRTRGEGGISLSRRAGTRDVQEPEATTLERREAAFARKAVDALAERDRLALLMKEEGLDYAEIAEALDLSPGSVGTTLSRARRRLVEGYEALQHAREDREKNAAS